MPEFPHQPAAPSLSDGRESLPIRIVTACIAVYWLVLMTATHVPRTPDFVSRGWNDKWLHAAAYAVLATGVFLRVRLTGADSRAFWFAIGLLGLAGAADELTQPFVGRNCDFIDWAADMTGVLLVAAGFAAWNALSPYRGGDTLQPTAAEHAVNQPDPQQA
jgi:VanZ family protein